MKTKRLMIIGLILLVAAGRLMPMSLMPEPGDPWYLPYTSWWWIVAGLIFLPSALVSEVIGLSVSDQSYLIVDAIWLILLCLLLYWIPASLPKSKPQ